MPSTHQAASGRDYADFPGFAEGHDENPARWLDREILGHKDRLRVIKGLIRGMDRIARVRYWKAVERNPRCGTKDGPREGIIRMLDQREERLEEIGERPDRLRHGPRRPPEMFDTESQIEMDSRQTAHDKLQRHRKAATDGGTTNDD